MTLDQAEDADTRDTTNAQRAREREQIENLSDDLLLDEIDPELWTTLHDEWWELRGDFLMADLRGEGTCETWDSVMRKHRREMLSWIADKARAVMVERV